MYKIGDRLMEIPNEAFSLIGEGNRTNALFDCRFVAILILSLTEIEKILCNEIPEEILDFVKGILNIKIRNSCFL